MSATTCVHCNITLTAADVASGWCDSCGKRLPGGARYTPKKASAEAPAAPVAGRPRSAWAWGVAVLALFAVAAASVVAFAR